MAIAPEQIGIGIRRHFTEPGTHPYDLAEWELREARIPNFKDGTDAFFQPEVEFPVNWSQNATNIVAQKYFRGTLGTAERETSLKQVIDRIVDTVTVWGMRDGYFLDDAEGACSCTSAPRSTRRSGSTSGCGVCRSRRARASRTTRR